MHHKYHLPNQNRSDKNTVVHPPHRVPVTLRSKVKDELDRMTRLTVIERVHEPTNWVNSMVTVTKPNGKLRICIDPRDLNRAIKREHYPMRTTEEVVTRTLKCSQSLMLTLASGKSHSITKAPDYALSISHLEDIGLKGSLWNIVCPRCFPSYYV